MLSRHNIRIKVLQTLYAHSQTEGSTAKLAERNYLKSVDESYRLYLLNVLFLVRVAEYTKKSYEIKAKKFIKTDVDSKASLRLFENPVIQSIIQNESFQRKLKSESVAAYIDEDLVRNLYMKFSESEYYQTYVEAENVPIREHQYCLVNLYKFMIEQESFIETLEDLFPTCIDDLSLVFGAMKRSIRMLPESDDFHEDQLPNDEFVQDFGKELLYKTTRHDEELLEFVSEKLKNWKEDRVAVMDMHLLKLGIAEFLYFPSIPTKVTINEYVALAKDYSTDKSKRFVNGILDRVMRDLLDQGRIAKEGRGLKDS